jgi:hypothetical protein
LACGGALTGPSLDGRQSSVVLMEAQRLGRDSNEEGFEGGRLRLIYPRQIESL